MSFYVVDRSDTKNIRGKYPDVASAKWFIRLFKMEDEWIIVDNAGAVVDKNYPQA
jgi:hypothetical protein